MKTCCSVARRWKKFRSRLINTCTRSVCYFRASFSFLTMIYCKFCHRLRIQPEFKTTLTSASKEFIDLKSAERGIKSKSKACTASWMSTFVLMSQCCLLSRRNESIKLNRWKNGSLRLKNKCEKALDVK